MKRKLSPEEFKLWQAQMRGVKPLTPLERKEVEITPTDSSPKAESQKQDTTPKSFQKTTPSLDTSFVNSFTRQDLRRLKVEGRIDLHGMTLRQGQAALEDFLCHAQEKGLKVVLVITGKGSMSSEQTLRHQLQSWVKEDPLRAYVSSLQYPARLRDGGAGAFYLRIRKKKTRKP